MPLTNLSGKLKLTVKDASFIGCAEVPFSKRLEPPRQITYSFIQNCEVVFDHIIAVERIRTECMNILDLPN